MFDEVKGVSFLTNSCPECDSATPSSMCWPAQRHGRQGCQFSYRRLLAAQVHRGGVGEELPRRAALLLRTVSALLRAAERDVGSAPADSELMCRMPTSVSSMASRLRVRSWVKMAAERPNSLSFARAKASSTIPARRTVPHARHRGCEGTVCCDPTRNRLPDNATARRASGASAFHRASGRSHRRRPARDRAEQQHTASDRRSSLRSGALGHEYVLSAEVERRAARGPYLDCRNRANTESVFGDRYIRVEVRRTKIMTRLTARDRRRCRARQPKCVGGTHRGAPQQRKYVIR